MRTTETTIHQPLFRYFGSQVQALCFDCDWASSVLLDSEDEAQRFHDRHAAKVAR